eukprot:s1_g838.t1
MVENSSNVRRTALITGASAGIGWDIALVFAEKGFDLVLVARRKDRLEALAQEVKDKFGTSSHIITIDLADPHAGQKIEDTLSEAGITIDALVNNAGYTVSGPYQDSQWQDQSDLIQVMVTSVAELCHRFAPGMAERGYGRIINVSSLAGHLPGAAGGTLYAASKSFLIKMSESLSLEYVNDNVHVTALCPGFTYSEFHDVAGTREEVSRMPGILFLFAISWRAAAGLQVPVTTELLTASDEDLERAADALRQGRLVAFPTETVYGLGADATNDDAVAAIFATKKRPTFNPLIVHVKDLAEAEAHADIDEVGKLLAKHFWPGGLTLVVPRQSDCRLSLLVSAGLDTVALRVPADDVAQQLLSTTERPLAAPSANPSGRLSPTEASHVMEGLGGEEALSYVVDGGPCRLGLESTVVGLPKDGPPTLLRPGAIPRSEIEAVLGQALEEPQAPGGDEGRSSPGMLASHYAPNAALRLNASDRGANELLLGFGDVVCDLSLSPSGDLQEAAANLFSMLRKLDAEAGAKSLAVSPIPMDGLGEAINDRLERAAAPRD